ncbi:hypothetical protein H4R34_000148 [Dimargaris verticillata]|uniref:Armadillo repeat-containing protein 8 n=1 Tax=Dimargaris verticillata TaxID=2761393 RepID=A0A9W8B7J9_9FUNG|nr:hypothetical protein H4R34_000148 [Dimargaris verticillata]
MLYTDAQLSRHHSAARTLLQHDDWPTLYTTARFIKNNVIGNATKKQLYVEWGIVPRLVTLIAHTIAQAVETQPDPEGVVAQRQAVAQECLVILASVCQGSPQGLRLALDHDLVPVLCRLIRPNAFPAAMVAAALSAFKAILAQIRWARHPASQALVSVLTLSTTHPVPTATMNVGATHAEHRAEGESATGPHQAASWAVADAIQLDRATVYLLVELLDPMSDLWGQQTVPTSMRTTVAQTSALVLARLCEVAPIEDKVDGDESLDITFLDRDGGGLDAQKSDSPVDFPLVLQARAIQLLIRLMTSPKTRLQAAALDAIASLIRDRFPMASVVMHTSPDAVSNPAPSPVPSSALAAILDMSRPSNSSTQDDTVRLIYGLTGSTDTMVQMLAVTCMAYLHRAKVIPQFESHMAQSVVPTLVRLMCGFRFRKGPEGITGVVWDALATRYIEDPELAASNGQSSLMPSDEYIGYNASWTPRRSSGYTPASITTDSHALIPVYMHIPIVLAYLAADREPMQQACCDAGAIPVLVDILCKLVHSSSEDPFPTHLLAESAGAGSLGDPGAVSDMDRLRESVLIALAALCSNSEACRDKLAARGLRAIVQSLGYRHAGIRVAACQCIRSLSRSVKQLRTHLVDVKVGGPLYKLLDDPQLPVRLSAMDALCNIVLSFSPIRTLVIDEGGIEKCVSLTDDPVLDVRMKALRILKNLVYRATESVVARTMNALSFDRLAELALGSDASIQQQTLGFLRNVTTIGAQWNANLLAGLGEARFLQVLQAALQPTAAPLLVEALYIIVNFSTGGGRLRSWVMRQAPLVHAIEASLQSDSSDVIIAAVWCVTNLTMPDSEDGEDEAPGRHNGRNEDQVSVTATMGSDIQPLSTAMDTEETAEPADDSHPLLEATLSLSDRIERFKEAGVERCLQRLTEYPHLEVRNRAKAALAHFSTARSLLPPTGGTTQSEYPSVFVA